MYKALIDRDPSTQALLPRTSNPVRLGAAWGLRAMGRLEARRSGSRAGFRLSRELRRVLDDYYSDDTSFVHERFGVSLRADPMTKP
jgi:hypothetical protein